MGYGVEKPSDVIGQHGYHFVVVPGCLNIIHHSEECILCQLAWDASEVGWGYEIMLSCDVCQTSCLYSFKGLAYYFQQLYEPVL